MTLPEADPDLQYEWDVMGAEPEETDETRAYTEALSAYLGTAFPGYEDVSAGGPVGGGTEGVTQFYRSEAALRSKSRDLDPVPAPTGFTMPTYNLFFISDTVHSNHGRLRFTENGPVDGVHIAVYPRGGFTDGTEGGPFDLVTCVDWERDTQAGQHQSTDATCAYETLPNGDRAVHVTNNVTNTTGPDAEGAEGTTAWSCRSTVLYRADGTAIVIDDYPDEAVDGAASSLTSADLLGIATALPDVAVR